MSLERTISEFIKKIYFVIMFMVISITVIWVIFSGSTEKKQLHEKIMIKGIGVDYEEGEYTLSIQALDFKNPAGEKEPSIKNLELKGSSVGAAVTKISQVTGLKPLFSQNLIIIVGEEAAKLGFKKFMNFFTKYYENRLNVKLRLAENKASEIFKIKSNSKPITAENLKSLVNSSNDTDVLDFERNVASKISDPVMFVINEKEDDENLTQDKKDGENKPEATEEVNLENQTEQPNPNPEEESNESKDKQKDKNTDEKKEEKMIICEKMAIFSNDKLVYILDKEETLALEILRGSSNIGSIEIGSNSKDGVCTIENVITKISLSSDKKSPTFVIDLNILLSIIDLNNTKDDIEEVKEQIKLKMTNKLNLMLKHVLNKILSLKCDPFKFGKILRKDRPNYFKTIENKWRNVLPTINYKLNINTDIEVIGTGL